MAEAKFMIDRVAEAIARVAVRQKVPDFHSQAVAAVMAMREPILAMVFAPDRSGSGDDGPDSAEIWQDMIDAAVTEVTAGSPTN
jgi:hypothetical protein